MLCYLQEELLKLLPLLPTPYRPKYQVRFCYITDECYAVNLYIRCQDVVPTVHYSVGRTAMGKHPFKRNLTVCVAVHGG
jgi:hypothetical protein